MGVIQVSGPSGKSYRVQISGTVPSPTEQERIRQYVSQQESQFSQEYAGMFGQEPVFDDGTALGRGFELGKAGAYSRLGTAAEYLGQGLGIESLTGVGQRMRQEGDYETFLERLRQPTPTRREDVTGIGSALTYVGEGIGQSVPEMLAPLAASAAGTIAGGPLVGLGAGAATAFPTFFGGNIQRQEGQVAAGELDAINVQAAIAAAVGQSTLNSIGDKLLLGGFLRPGQKWLTRTAIGAGEGAAVEIPTEIAQQMLERKQAGLPLDSDDAISEYIDAGILGGIMGGGVRATTAGLGIGVERPPATPITDPARLLSGPPNDAQTIAAKIVPSADTVTPGPATANNKTTVQSGGKTVTRVKLSDGAVLEFDTAPTQAQLDGALAQYNASKTAETGTETEPTPLPDIEPFGAPEVVARWAALEEADKDALATKLGTDSSGLVDIMLDDPTRANRAMDDIAREKRGPAAEPTPAAPAAPTATDFTALMDELGIPRTAAVRKAVQSGAVKTEEDFRTRLAKFAAATTSDRAARVNEYLQRGATPVAEPEVQAEPAAPAAPAPTTQETADAETAPSGPVEPDERGMQALVEMDFSQATNTDFALRSIAYRLQQGGAFTFTRPESIAAAKADPRLLVIDNPDGTVTVVGVKVNETSPWVGQSPTTQETTDAETAPSGPVEPDERGSGDGFERGSEQPSTQPVAGEPDTTPAVTPDVGPVGGAVLGAPEPSVAEGQQPDALTPLPDIEPFGAPEVVARQAKLEEADKDALAAKLGTDRSGVVDIMLDDPARANRAMDDIAREKRGPTPLPYTPMAGAMPGATTGAAGQVIPSPTIAPQAPVKTPSSAVQNVVEQIRAERNTVVEQEAKVAAQAGINAWYDQNASPEKKAALRAMLIGTAPSPLSATDTQAVLSLLNRAPKQRAKGKVTPERAAFVYFSQTPNIDFALRSIAYDHAQVMETDPDAREPDFRRATEFDDPAEAAFYAGTGVEPASRAAQWVRENLSEQTRQKLAEYTFTEYRPIDYSTQSANRDVRSERQRQMQTELDKFISETYTPDTPPRASFSMTDNSGRLDRAHPRVEALIRAGNFKAALKELAFTARNKTHRLVANKLFGRIPDIRSEVVDGDTMAALREILFPEARQKILEAVYIHPLTAKKLEAMRREGREAAANVIESYGGTVFFNEDVGLSPELILHEATHPVADNVLYNKSHPLTRQLDKLRVELLKFMPPTHYGLTDVHEFLAEGLNNPTFHSELGYANAEGRKFSARENFKDILGNWLRGVIGLPPKKRDTAADVVDRALDAIIDMGPVGISGMNVASASFSQDGAATVIKNAFQNARVPTKADLVVTRNMMKNTKIPVGWKGTLLRYAVPLDYVADMASPYLPSARAVHNLIGRHQRAIREGVELVVNTTEETAKVMAKYARQQPLIDSFNDAAYMATRLQVDPRKPESAYKGYSYQYNVLDKDGNIVRRVESKRYASETERNKALQAYNAALPEDRKGNRIARARRAFDESPETTTDHKRVRDMYLAMPADMQKEFSRMLELQPAVGKGWADAIRTRIETLLPKDKALQNRIYGTIYDKILSGRMLDPYLALERSGPFRLSYSAIDPLSITVDPVTGAVDMSNAQVEQFKHSFESEGERRAAIRALEALPPENRVTDINAYQDARSGFSQQEVSLDFVSRVLDAVDSSGELANALDPKTGATNDVRQQIINLMLDSVPESSFINSFKKRQGIRGFRGDVTPISEPKAAGDVLKNMRESAMRIARKTADLKYGAEFAAVRKALNDENVAFQNTNPLALSPQELSRQRAEVSQYADVLTDYTRAPFNIRSRASRFAGAGTYMLTLGFNVSTALVTLSQIPLFVYPVLAGKYSDARALGAIGAAHRILAGAGRERETQRIGPDGKIETGTAPVRLWEHSTEYNTSPYLAPLIEYARKNGVFNRSLMQDELLGEQPTLTQKISAATGIMQHQSERYSRETALNAAYILELQDLMARQDMSVSDFVKGLEAGTLTFSPEIAQAAAESAVNVSEKSNGPIYAAAGPIASQGNFMSLVYMFKRHPLAMMNLLAHTASRGMGSTDPADRRIAQRQLARMMASLSVFSGVLGLPLMQQLGWLYDLLIADDDDPDFKTAVRTTLGEFGAYGLVDYMTGLKVSERIGMGSAIYRPGFASQDANPVFQIAEGLGGPVLGMVLKYGSGRQLEDLQNGEYQRFAEGIMPTSIANFFKAVRFAQEGAQTRRGDLMDDIGPFHIAAQAFGFMPASYSQQLAMNSLGTKVNNAINTKKSRLMQQVHKARSDGDFERVRELMVEIQEFNARNPRNRIDRETLKQSYESSRRVTAQTSNGLYVSPGNRMRIQEMLDAYGRSSIFE